MTKGKRQSPLSDWGPWNKVSAGYEKFTRRFLAKYSMRGLERLELERGHALLDVACGPGTTSLIAAPHVGRIEAIDFSPHMVEIFRGHIQRLGLSHVRAQVGDGQNLPFADASFERATSMFGLMFFPDRVEGMKEIHRCLKPGGRALISSWASSEASPLMRAIFDAVRFADPDSPSPRPDLDSLENPDVFERELRESGFSDIVIEPCVCTYDYTSGGQLWDEMVEGGVPLVLARESMSPEDWNSFSATCRAYLEENLENRDRLGSTAYLAFATR